MNTPPGQSHRRPWAPGLKKPSKLELEGKSTSKPTLLVAEHGRTHPRKFQQRDQNPAQAHSRLASSPSDETRPSRDAWTLLPADLRMTMHRRCCIPRCASSSTTHRTGGAAGRRDRVGKVRKSNTETKGTSCHTQKLN